MTTFPESSVAQNCVSRNTPGCCATLGFRFHLSREDKYVSNVRLLPWLETLKTLGRKKFCLANISFSFFLLLFQKVLDSFFTKLLLRRQNLLSLGDPWLFICSFLFLFFEINWKALQSLLKVHCGVYDHWFYEAMFLWMRSYFVCVNHDVSGYSAHQQSTVDGRNVQ